MGHSIELDYRTLGSELCHVDLVRIRITRERNMQNSAARLVGP